jgi:hypothetical protein
MVDITSRGSKGHHFYTFINNQSLNARPFGLSNRLKSFDMKRALAFALVAVVIVFAVACNKSSSGPSAGYGPSSLFPTTAGDTWYFVDSGWSSDSVAPQYYNDTMVATKNAYQDASGTVYLEMQNPYGWFDGSYIAVDPSNAAVYEVDSPYFQPYTMFALVNADGPIAATSTDYTNPACPVYYNQYGYAAPITEYNYSCYKNSEVITNCNGTVLEETDYFLSEGVGVVRIADYLTDTAGGANVFYEDYSQTLTGKVLK